MKGEKDEGGFKSALEKMCVTALTCSGEGEKETGQRPEIGFIMTNQVDKR